MGEIEKAIQVFDEAKTDCVNLYKTFLIAKKDAHAHPDNTAKEGKARVLLIAWGNARDKVVAAAKKLREAVNKVVEEQQKELAQLQKKIDALND